MQRMSTFKTDRLTGILVGLLRRNTRRWTSSPDDRDALSTNSLRSITSVNETSAQTQATTGCSALNSAIIPIVLIIFVLLFL